MVDELIIQQVAEEQYQGKGTRRTLYEALEEELQLAVVSLFTSFVYPVTLEDSDADMLEGVLQKTNVSEGFALFLSSPGGRGLAAERIINVCRSYSGTGEYQVIVPGKAKSAATMICLGASNIIMVSTSELGSVDPQIVITEEGEEKWFSAYNMVKSYEELFEAAVEETGNLQPYLQQLAHYDAREIAELRSALSLSEDIAVKALKTGMLSELSETKIKGKVKKFLSPEEVKTHGRPIYAQEATACGLSVETRDLNSAFWQTAYELYYRLNNYVSQNQVSKCIETKDHSFMASYRGQPEG